MDKVNLLYCFDGNYDQQAFLSISSIVDNSDDIFEIYIIHKTPNTFLSYKDRLLKNENIKNINIFKFKKDLSNYPQLRNKHVSEATYFRLFISEYLPKEIGHVLYCDPDVFCIKNLSFTLSYLVNDFLNQDKPIGVNVEKFLNKENKDYFNNLEMKSTRYFNAGVMFINLNLWNLIISDELVKKKINSLQNVIILWDQDVLNSIFDGNYYEISNLLNFRITYPIDTKFFKENVLLIHYSGNHKPWTVEGALDIPSVYFSEIYQRYFSDKYSLKLKGTKLYAIKYLFKSVINGNLFRLKYPFSYILEFIKSILRNNQ